MESVFECLTVPTPHLTPHLTRVTGVVCEIWIDLGRGGGLGLGCLLLRPRKGDGWAEGEKSNFDWTCGEFQTLPPATMEGHSVRHPLRVLIVCLDT